ncbi:uncharacterized protein EDB91DRAFT_1064859 [Suillus paluster]|uniref:uncharacterized protein n=1 Tax=Suillus paluster TaxID=48578 RepID=UPI001B85BFAD|nr:uncharacterized protein EDB91DRAFT_1064859 [Suillus paluster]KAG1720456.1 hypothetical protein EDB91DRAFT_1064859 [Suillus paluster]
MILHVTPCCKSIDITDNQSTSSNSSSLKWVLQVQCLVSSGCLVIRQPEHIIQFLFAEMGTAGSVDGWFRAFGHQRLLPTLPQMHHYSLPLVNDT